MNPGAIDALKSHELVVCPESIELPAFSFVVMRAELQQALPSLSLG